MHSSLLTEEYLPKLHISHASLEGCEILPAGHGKQDPAKKYVPTGHIVGDGLGQADGPAVGLGVGLYEGGGVVG